MDYEKHYNALIEQARLRSILGDYTEKHHIQPRCLGGSDADENLVALTPEEHYVAHQLLVKMHPGNKKLVYALSKMTQGRPNNKRYGWVRRRWQEVCKQRTGESNGSYGKSWYHNPETGEAGKFLPADVPYGWIKGRVKRKPNTFCQVCNKNTGLKTAAFCTECRKEYFGNLQRNKNPFAGKEHEFYELYLKHKTYSASLREFGLNPIGAWFYQAKEIVEKYEREHSSIGRATDS